MRIAVVQLAVNPTQRTLTFQRALQAIDAAAETDPAPDLILLPAFADVPAMMGGDAEIIERLAGPTVAACGQRARQWGVFVALGLAEQMPDGPCVAGVLLDNDGDVCLANRQRTFRSTAGGGFAIGEDLVSVNTLLGRMTILVGDDLLDGGSWEAAARTGAALILGTACWARPGDAAGTDAKMVGKRISEYAGRYGLGCAVADVTIPDEQAKTGYGGSSLIVDDHGKVLAAAEAGKPSTLWAVLELPQAPARLGGET